MFTKMLIFLIGKVKLHPIRVMCVVPIFNVKNTFKTPPKYANTHAITVERAQRICRHFLGSRSGFVDIITTKPPNKHVHKKYMHDDYVRIRDLTDNRSDRGFPLVFLADFHGVRIRPIVPTCGV